LVVVVRERGAGSVEQERKRKTGHGRKGKPRITEDRRG